MQYDNFSISLPRGYADSLTEEAKRYGLNRSEFVRVLCDGYYTIAASMMVQGKREHWKEPDSGLDDYFPEVLPHRKAEAHEWFRDYIRLVLRIVKNAEERKRQTGSVEQDSVDITLRPEDENLSN